MNFKEDNEQDYEDCERDSDEDCDWNFEENDEQDYKNCEKNFDEDYDLNFEADSEQNYEDCEWYCDRNKQDFASCEKDLLNSLIYIESVIWSDEDFNKLYMINLFLIFNKHFTDLIKTLINNVWSNND